MEKNSESNNSNNKKKGNKRKEREILMERTSGERHTATRMKR